MAERQRERVPGDFGLVGGFGEEIPRPERRRSHTCHEVCSGDEVCPSGHTFGLENFKLGHWF